MQIKSNKFLEILSEMSKLFHFDISLSGWPAAVVALGAGATIVAVQYIKTKGGNEPDDVPRIDEKDGDDDDNST